MGASELVNFWGFGNAVLVEGIRFEMRVRRYGCVANICLSCKDIDFGVPTLGGVFGIGGKSGKRGKDERP